MNRRGFLKGAALSLSAAYLPFAAGGSLSLDDIKYDVSWSQERMAYLNSLHTRLPSGVVWHYSLLTTEPLTDKDKVRLYTDFIDILQRKGVTA